jgi:transcriptional regulator with XRE-family HTH domain
LYPVPESPGIGPIVPANRAWIAGASPACNIVAVDFVRVGRSVRALRRRRGWRQTDLARAARTSQTTIGRIERGQGDRVPPRTLDRILQALGARLRIQVDWNGEALDRLLDSEHARLVEETIGYLSRLGWECAAEVTFSIDRERGSVDILAWHAGARVLVVIEVKTVVPDVQAMLAALDRKTRLGKLIAKARGWQPVSVGCLLVIRESRTSRRRVEAHGLTFAAELPQRGVAVRRWLANPAPGSPVRGLWFVSDRHDATPRHRVRNVTRRVSA